MSSATLSRLSRTSLVLGSILIALGIIADFFSGSDQASTLAVATAFIRLAGVLFLLLGFPGVYAAHAARSGGAGMVGFILTFLSLGMAGAFETILAIAMPVLAAHGLANGHLPASGFLYNITYGVLGLIGEILLGQSILRQKAAARWAGLVIILGALVSFFASVVARPIGDIGTVAVVLGLAWFAMGVDVQAPVAAPSARPSVA